MEDRVEEISQNTTEKDEKEILKRRDTENRMLPRIPEGHNRGNIGERNLK